MIYITGDTHGLNDFNKIEQYFKNRYVSTKDYLIILGDAGFIWDNDTNALTKYKLLDITIIFIDGNHENFDLLNEFPIITYLSARMHMISKNIYHVLRGEIMIINKKKFLCLGGACSIDKAYRINHLSFWEDEVIIDEDINNALNNLKKYNNKVDYVLTHCIDSSTLIKYFGYKPDKSTDKLSIIKNIVNYNYWFFGHYHTDGYLDKKRKVFYQDILELNYQYTGKNNARDIYYSYNNGVMRSSKGRIVKIKPNDLPEWYYEHYSYYYHYYNLKDVVDVAFRRSPFDNHINKDCVIYLSYTKIHEKDEQYRPINKEEYELRTWRVSLIDFIKALEKYSPNLNLDKLKAQVNIAYDFFANNPTNYIGSNPPNRPYPDIETPILKEINYSVYYNNIILLNFIEKELAVKYAEVAAKTYFKSYKILDQDEYKIINEHNKQEYIIVKKITGKKANYGFKY